MLDMQIPKSTHLLTRTATLYRLIREITKHPPAQGNGPRSRIDALAASQEAAVHYLVGLLDDANLGALQATRVMLL